MMQKSREFQIFAKPVGAICNLSCRYCYYLEKGTINKDEGQVRMSEDILEKYIIQHIEASTEPAINFSWHGGEPTLAGLDFFRKVVELQKKYKPGGRTIINGIQTNATLLNNDWCKFFSAESFFAGVSMDGPEELHDIFRNTKNRQPTFRKTLNGHKLLMKHKIPAEILCVVNAKNVSYPSNVYRFFKHLGAEFITFLPLVEREQGTLTGASSISVPAEAFGAFLNTVFDEWVAEDIGKIKIQIFEEVARTAFNQEHTLCIFKKICGGVPVVEHNGDFYSCDHYVDKEHLVGNINSTSLTDLLDSNEQKLFGQAKFNTLPEYCLECEVRDMCNGECPKNRFIKTPSGEPGLNYLCRGYKLFFNHVKPFVDAIAEEWRKQKRE